MQYIKTAEQRRWVKAFLQVGLLRYLGAGKSLITRREGCRRYLAKLEEQGVIEQWTIVTDDRHGDAESFELVHPSSRDPLYVAGKRWDKFMAEAAKLGLTGKPVAT